MDSISKLKYRKYFYILAAVFLIYFIVEFIFTALGNPLGDIHIQGLDLEKATFSVWLFRSFILSLFVSSFVNFYLSIQAIKLWRKIERLPTGLVIALTVTFPIMILISMVLVIPDLIIFFIKGFCSK